MNLRKISYTIVCFLLSAICLVGCGEYLSEEEKDTIISNQVNYMNSLEDEMSLIWDAYADSEGLISFYGYLDTDSDTYKASQEMRAVIETYEPKITSESIKIDKNKVEDNQFLEYLNNIDEYVFAINNYTQAMEDGDSDKFSKAKEDVERYAKLIMNYAEYELSN